MFAREYSRYFAGRSRRWNSRYRHVRSAGSFHSRK